jgi:hypothetical protein
LIASALPTSRKHSLLLKSQHSLKIDIGCFILIEANLSSGSFADFLVYEVVRGEV